MGDVPKPARRGAGAAEGVQDVLAVGPGLHDAGRGQGAGAHRRSVPGQAGLRVQRRKSAEKTLSFRAPPGQERRYGERPAPDQGILERIGQGRQLRQVTGKSVRVGGRQTGRTVEEGQMADLVADGPGGKGRFELPLFLRKRRDDDVQRFIFLREVSNEVFHFVGATPPRRNSIPSAAAPRSPSRRSCLRRRPRRCRERRISVRW